MFINTRWRLINSIIKYIDELKKLKKQADDAEEEQTGWMQIMLAEKV